MTRFFVSSHSTLRNEITELSKEELESNFDFIYTDKTTAYENFRLPRPYDLALDPLIVRLSEINKRFNVLTNPEKFLVLRYEPKTGWGCIAKQTIPKNTVITTYAGIVYNAKDAQKDDDYTHVASLPFHSYDDILRTGILKYLASISTKTQGNLSRFFQHLPKKEDKIANFDDIAYENLQSVSAFDEEKEIPMIFLVTSRDIPEGHPVGFNYGRQHFDAIGLTPHYFTLRGRSFSSRILPKLIALNEKWRIFLAKLKSSAKTTDHEIAQIYQFFSYQDLCDLACVNKSYNRNVQPLLNTIRGIP